MVEKQKYILEGSLGALIQEYRASPEFDRLVDETKQAYLRSISRLAPLYRVKVDEIRRRHIITLRNQIRHTPGAANHLVSVVSVLMKFAVMMEYRDDLLAGIEKLPVGEHRRWLDEDVEFALNKFPEHLRRAVVLGLYTGQRASDLVKMKWSDFDGEGITVTQKKTGTSLWLPCHLELRKELEVWKMDRTTMTILSRPSGQPYSAAALSSAMSKMIARCQPKLLGLRFHGLRMTAAAKLAEAGCSVHEIASITGHKSLQMIEHYTAGADQIRRAKAAIIKLEQYSAN